MLSLLFLPPVKRKPLKSVLLPVYLLRFRSEKLLDEHKVFSIKSSLSDRELVFSDFCGDYFTAKLLDSELTV